MTNLITEYMGTGPLSARPATPNVTVGCTAFYWGTDTNTLYAWDGSAWQTASSPPALPSIRQTLSLFTSDTTAGFNLPSAPVVGNMIIVFCSPSSSLNVVSGWGSRRSVTSFTVAFRRVQAGDTTSVAPFSGTTRTGAVVIYEIENCNGVLEEAPDEGRAEGSVTTSARSQTIVSSFDALVIGATSRNNDTLPTSITGGTTLDNQAGPGDSVATYSLTVSPGNSYTTTQNYATSASTYLTSLVLV